MSKKLLIFDFDGTIADTHHFIVSISNRMADEFRYESIAQDEIAQLKDKTAKEIIKILKIPVMKIPAILAKGKNHFFNDMDLIEPFEGLRDVLIKLKDIGVEMGILSSNNGKNIDKFLKSHHMDFFDFVQSTSQIWGKNISLNKFLKANNLNKDDVLYIGDETRDITAAKKLGVEVAAVSWGYNSSKVLEKYQPDYLINSPQDLYNLCMKFC